MVLINLAWLSLPLTLFFLSFVFYICGLLTIQEDVPEMMSLVEKYSTVLHPNHALLTGTVKLHL